MMIPYLMPQLPQAQRAALAQNVKTPLVYTNVLVRDWQAWARLKVADIVAPMSFHNRVSLDFPVSLGGYRNPRDPAEPMVLHMVHVPGAPNAGLDARAQFRAGRAKLLDMTFADFEAKIGDELDRMLGPGGFSSARDILAITVNRWSHGYGYVANSLFDGDDYEETLRRARQTLGASPLRIPMPVGMRMHISPSTTPNARSVNCWGDNALTRHSGARALAREPGSP